MSNADSPNDAFLGAFMDDYFAECDEHLTTIRHILLDAERPGTDLSRSAIEELFRSFHSVKGLSGMVELRDAELLSHHMEAHLRHLRDAGANATAVTMTTLIEGTHALEQVIAARRANQPSPSLDRVMAQLEALPGRSPLEPPPLPSPSAPVHTAAGGLPVAGTRRWLVVFTPSADLAARGIGVDSVRALLREGGDILEAIPRVDADGAIRFEFTVEGTLNDFDADTWLQRGLTVTPLDTETAVATESSAAEPVAEAQPSLLAPSHYVRVDLTRLDDLMRMIGDLVITRARLGDSLARIESHVPQVEWRPVQENALTLERQLRDLREGVMRVRLVPVGEIFRRMPFVVRDLARETGKNVQLAMRGQDTEIDKFLIERMLDPVLHLVRNAVSHGIESAEERARAGKPAAATITLSAANVGDLVILEIADDGRGVDVPRVLERARSVGMPVPDGEITDDALLQILCAPGFSTRDEADRASGRGVGMAVVQTTVQELGGRVSLETTAGEGTRFVIELPVTLAIVDAIIARVGTQTFAIAQTAVREVMDVSPDALRALENNEVIPYRGGVLPIVRLADLFALESRPGRALHVFVIGHGAAAVGIAVDRILGQREIVVRTLADSLVKVDGVVGATDLGDGRVVLILDAARLTARRSGTRSVA